MIDRYKIDDIKSRVRSFIQENRESIMRYLMVGTISFGSGALISYALKPSSDNLSRFLQNVPDVQPSRTVFEDRIDKHGKPNKDGTKDLILIYDQYGGLEVPLPGPDFKGIDQR